MNKVGAKFILWGLILAMLGFTTTRTLNFLQLTFPPDQQYIAYLGLAAFDVGVLGWFYYATAASQGKAQRAIAYGMIFVCATGVITTTVLDTLLVSSQNGLVHFPSQWSTLGVWAVILVICLNFLAGILVHLVDPNQLANMKTQHLRDEIIEATHKRMEQEKARISPIIAENLASHWATSITEELTGKLPNLKTIDTSIAKQLTNGTASQNTEPLLPVAEKPSKSK